MSDNKTLYTELQAHAARLRENALIHRVRAEELDIEASKLESLLEQYREDKPCTR